MIFRIKLKGFLPVLTAAGMLLNAGTTAGQDTTNIKSIINEGNRLLEKGYFGAALPVWKSLWEKNPENADVNFKLGLCYRYSYDEQAKALPYFKKAASHTVSQYNFYRMTWGEASFDALYFLGETYLMLNEPDSALKYFLLYTDLYGGNPPISTDRQIRASLNVKNAVKSPRNVKLVNLGDQVNSEYPESNPVVTLDNSVIFFSSRRPRKDVNDKIIIDKVTGKYPEDIYYSRKDKSGKWQNPLLFRHNTEFNEAPLCLSPDGLTLYFRREEKNGDVNLYQSSFANGVWSDPVKLGSNINSSAKETGLGISTDSKYLYFSSDRVGGLGGMDVYQCVKLPNGKWSKAKNLGKVINTPHNEISPFAGANNTLFYCSNGNRSKGIGGYDIFYSELRPDGTWTEPQNIGYPINTSRENQDYYVAGSGIRYCSNITDGKSFDIYEIQGGGFEFENIDVGKEIVTLTTEMNVTEVVEVEKEVVKEVEVVQLVENPESETKETEVVDVTAATDPASVSPADSALAMGPESKPEETPEPEKPKLDIDVEALNLDDLDSLDRVKLIDKVKKYLVREIRSNESVVFKTLYFDFNKVDLDLLSRNELKLLVDFLRENPKIKIEIAGHTDSKGPWDANIRVSSGRAKAVKDYLVAHNISERKILHYGKASSAPVAGNDSEEGRKLNRRVEVILVK